MALGPWWKKMTVVKKQRGGQAAVSLSKKSANFDFTSLDNLIKTIDALESEEQVPELIENEELLTKSFKSILSLMGENENGFDETAGKIDENVLEIMSKFFEDGLIDEEEFEDFFTEELAEECDDSESNEDSEGSDSSEGSEESELSENVINEFGGKQKKSKHLKELEMLMEKVEDESDLDAEDYETESDGSGAESDGSDKMDIFFTDDNDQVSGGRMSSFERSQVTLKDQISALESENVESQKPWSLRGEINARQRPSDSLLEEAVDFDNLSRPVPQITEERTEEIEDVIKRRIGEAAWDDVERKDGRDLTLLNGMSKDQQKSARALLEDVATSAPQRSLSQVYEDEASTKLSAGKSPQSEEIKEKQAELTALFAKICRHVDGLSGNRFAPKVYVQSDFQIKTLGKK